MCRWKIVCVSLYVAHCVSKQVACETVNTLELVWVLGSVELYLLHTVVCVFILSPGPLGVYGVGGTVS